jgi:hypothetical protein
MGDSSGPELFIPMLPVADRESDLSDTETLDPISTTVSSASTSTSATVDTTWCKCSNCC